MDPVTAGAVIGAGSSIASGLIGANQAAKDREQALALIEQSIRDYEAIGIPSIEAQQLALEEYKSAGVLTPELEQAVLQGNSAMEGISTDPRYKEAELDALNSLREIGSSGGTSAAGKARLSKIQGDINASDRGRREAVLSSIRERGQLGSGLELASLLQGAQDSAQNANQAGLQVAADEEQRALQAIAQAGTLGGNLRSQDFSEQERIAQAKDEISRFNTMAKQSVQQRNVGSLNDSQRFNLTNQQDLMDRNVDTRNKEQINNKGLYQQQYQNQLNLAGGKANARAGQASNLQQNAKDTANMWAGIGSGVSKAGLAYADSMARQQEEQKKRLA